MNSNLAPTQQSRRISSPFYQKRMFILAIPVSCLATSLIAFGWLQFNTTKAEEWVQHTQQVRLETQRLLKNLLDAETEVRGYALIRDQEFLNRYESAIAEIPTSLEDLNQLVADNPVQTQQIQQIRALVNARVSTIQHNLELIYSLPQNVTLSPELVSQLIEGKRTMDRARVQIEQFLAEEERLQREREQRLIQHRKLTWLILSLSAIIGISGSLLAAYLLSRLERNLAERDRSLRDSEARYRQLVELCPDGIFIQSQGKFALVNQAAVRLFGATTSEELIDKLILDLLHPEYREIVRERIQELQENQTAVPQIEEKWLRLDGTVFDAEVAAIPFSYNNQPSAQVVIRDITERKQSEEKLRQLNRSLRTLSECNQALVRATDEATLLQEICQIIVEFGGYCCVWIGFTEPNEAKTVRLVAQSGCEEDDLRFLQISSSDIEQNPNPIGTAIRTGQTCIVQNILTEPSNLPWREASIQRGYAAFITLPLISSEFSVLNYELQESSPIQNHFCFGVLNIYATESNAFDNAEIRLLTELANDLAYGIKALRTQIERRQALAALNESKQRLDGILNSLEDVVWSVSATTYDLIYLNPATERVYGHPVEAFFNNPNLWLEMVHPDDRKKVNTFHQDTLTMGSKNLEYRIVRPDGEVRWIYDRGHLTYDEKGTAVRLDGIATDITARKHAEELLRDSEAKFRAFLESASEAIIVTNSQGKIVVFNAKAQDLFGYDCTEVFGRTVEFLMPQRYHQIHPQHRAEYRVNPIPRSMSNTKNLFALCKDGREFPIEAGLSSIQTKDGTFVMTFLTDITERKQAEEEIKRLNQNLQLRIRESETRYEQIVELAEEGIWVIDREGKTTYVNHAMARMLGYTEVEMLGRSFFDFINEANRQQVSSSLIDSRHQSQVQRWELQLTTKSGQYLWVYMSTSVALDENESMLWACSLVYDITERKQAEERLRESSERISLANAELARATRLKDEFLASMSHELRTPLNAILGLSEALQEEVYGELTDRQRRSLQTIEQSGKHLLDLINDILDLSKIESGKMMLQITPVSVEHLCESSLTFVKQQAHQKNIRIYSKIGESIGDIKVDERRIRQVLVNLLSNAVKFTPEGGMVCLDIEADADAEIVKFSVIDTGIGIAPENINKLFKPFVQLDSTLSRRYAGTGLGLSLVRRIVELHGGSIALESEVGKGSHFTVILPWKEVEPIESNITDQPQLNGELPNIQQALIVEDSDTSAKQIARYLGELGAAVLIHPQGEGTIEAVGRFDPDVIILDILLPNLSGWEVLTQLKANPTTRDIPVLVISVVDERSQALELGASEYLLKPISRPQFQSALSKIFPTLPQRSRNTAVVVTPPPEEELPLILLAEDNEANISTLMDYLQVQGFRVNLARNGIEAVKMAKEQKPDLILMDIQMPEMDGLEAMRQIRTDTNLTTVPIIALTALAMPGDRERCLVAGANEYMTKPVSLKKLVNLIGQYLNPN
ncbi:MAG TPA: hypothetical protein DD379_12860 [Cyanobacteria bacterium UBA11162]|nr:hypothetical protein [Cyanobacteria bacterium UBA11162]